MPEYLFHFLTNYTALFALPPVIAAAITPIVFFDDGS